MYHLCNRAKSERSGVYIFPADNQQSKSLQISEGGGKNFLKDLDTAQIMLLQGYISGILLTDSVGTGNFEKNLKLENYLNRCFEVPYYFYKLSKTEAMERVMECFSPMNMGGRVGVIQFDITDKCNLNCALCSHFSPLVKEENRYSVEQFTKDAWRLRELTEHIDCIDLWGGEALLHPQLDKLIDISREVFKDSRVEVGTNGILVPNISDHILDAIKRNDCTLVISCYPPTTQMLDKIENRLKEREIKYRTNPIEKFFKRYELQGERDRVERHSTCFSKVCHVVKNGTYSSCYVPYGVQVFNQYFGEKINVKESIFDLYDSGLDMISFTQKVKEALDICRFCGDIELHSWKVAGADKDDISSWVNRYEEYVQDAQQTGAISQIEGKNRKGVLGRLCARMFK